MQVSEKNYTRTKVLSGVVCDYTREAVGTGKALGPRVAHAAQAGGNTSIKGQA